jgi:hypothetical protein
MECEIKTEKKDTVHTHGVHRALAGEPYQGSHRPEQQLLLFSGETNDSQRVSGL